MLYEVSGKVFLEYMVDELTTIVSDKHPGNSETGDYVFMKKLPACNSRNVGHCLGFDLFFHVVHGDEEEFQASSGYEEGSHNIHGPCVKRNREQNGQGERRRLSRQGRKSLAFGIILDIVVAVFFEIGPVVPWARASPNK